MAWVSLGMAERAAMESRQKLKVRSLFTQTVHFHCHVSLLPAPVWNWSFNNNKKKGLVHCNLHLFPHQNGSRGDGRHTYLEPARKLVGLQVILVYISIPQLEIVPSIVTSIPFSFANFAKRGQSLQGSVSRQGVTKGEIWTWPDDWII